MTEQQRAATDQLQAEVSKWQNAAEEARPSLAPSWLEDENDIFLECAFYNIFCTAIAMNLEYVLYH